MYYGISENCGINNSPYVVGTSIVHPSNTSNPINNIFTPVNNVINKISTSSPSQGDGGGKSSHPDPDAFQKGHKEGYKDGIHGRDIDYGSHTSNSTFDTEYRAGYNQGYDSGKNQNNSGPSNDSSSTISSSDLGNSGSSSSNNSNASESLQ